MFSLLVTIFVLMFTLCNPLSILKDSECGVSMGCYHDCNQNGCDFLISWRHVAEEGVVRISMNKRVDNPYDHVWFALGLSHDKYMGDDSVLECSTDEHTYWLAGVRQSYNKQYYNVDIFNSELGLRETSGVMNDGVLQCNFSKRVQLHDLNRIYDLDRQWYLLVASGYMKHGVKLRHAMHADLPHVSPVMVDLRDHVDISGKATYYLIKLHGGLMLFSWIIAASIAIVIARAFKEPWYSGMGAMVNRWNLAHKILMAIVFLCTLTSFVVIWWTTKDFSKVKSTLHLNTEIPLLSGSSIIQRAHPVLGVIIMGLVIINPIIAILRPSKATVAQPLFRYAHGFIGTVTFIISLLNMIIGVTLPKAATDFHVVWVMTGFAIYQVALYTVLEMFDLYLIRSGQLYAYETSRNIRSEIKEKLKDPPGTLVKKVVLAVHVVVSLAIGVYCIVIVAS